MFIRIIAFIKTVDDQNPWAVTGIEEGFVVDSKDRRKDQSLYLIPKRQGEDETVPCDGLLNVWTSVRNDQGNLIGDGGDEVVGRISTCGCSEEKETGEK